MVFHYGADFLLRQRGAAFSPASLFASGSEGVWYDPSDLSSMFQDSAGTVPAAAGSPVGLIRDKSGRAHHAAQGTDVARPMLRQDAGGRYYLEFEGTDDVLACAGTVPAGLTGPTSWMAAAQADARPNRYLAAILKASNSPIISLLKSDTTTGARQAAIILNDAGGTVVGQAPAAGTSWNGTPVVVSVTDSGSAISWYRNKEADGTHAYARSGSLSPDLIKLGAGASGWTGRIYGLIITQGVLSAAERNKAEEYLAERAGVAL